MPVDKNTFDFEFKLPIPQNQSITYTVDPNTIPMNNPNTITIVVTSENTSTLKNTSFILDVIQDHTTISSHKDSDFIVSQENPSNMELLLKLNISQHNLNINSGEYTLRFHTDGHNEEPLEFSVVYTPIAPYLSAKVDIPQGDMSLTLYYPDQNHKYLIPITRFVKHDTAILRTTINNLHEGSPILGFKDSIPRIPKLELKGGLLTVHLADGLGKFHKNESDAAFALNTLVDSLTAVPNVDQIKFLVNGRESNDIFYGHNTSTLFTPTTNNPKIYFGLDINKMRTLLVPIDMPPGENSNLYTEIFSSLQTGEIDGEASLSDLIATVPSDIKLLNVSENNQTLLLNFSKEFLYAYPDRIDLQKLMIDSILFSYTSMNKVTNVQFTVEGQIIDTFADLILTHPLSRPKYINPEKE